MQHLGLNSGKCVLCNDNFQGTKLIRHLLIEHQLLRLAETNECGLVGCSNTHCDTPGVMFHADLPLQFLYHHLLTCRGASPGKFLQEIVLRKIRRSDMNQIISIDKSASPIQNSVQMETLAKTNPLLNPNSSPAQINLDPAQPGHD